MGLRLGIRAPGSIKRPRQSQARWAVGLQTSVSLLKSLELSDVVSVVSSYHDGSSHLGLDNPFALFWFLNRDFYLVQMENPRGWILELSSELQQVDRNRRLQANPELLDLWDVVCGTMICSWYMHLKKFGFSIYTSCAHGVFGNPITLFGFRHWKIDFE